MAQRKLINDVRDEVKNESVIVRQAQKKLADALQAYKQGTLVVQKVHALAEAAAALEALKRDDKAENIYRQIIEVIQNPDNASEIAGCSDRASKFFSQVLYRAYVKLARNSLIHFACVLEWDFEKDQKFFYDRECVLREWFTEMEKLERREYDGLALSSPPRSGKTGAGFIFLLWEIMRHPDKSCLFVTHSNRVVEMMFNKFLKWFADKRRHIFDVFPDVEILNTSAEYHTIDLCYRNKIKDNDYKTLYLVSIDTQLAGGIEYTWLLYCDDLISGTEEAKNPDRLEGVWNKYANDISQRFAAPDTIEMHIATRWGTKDVITRIERNEYGEQGNRKWKFIIRPAVDESRKKSNFEFRVHPMTYQAFMVQKKKMSLEPYSWAAIYQQHPIEREGSLFADHRLKRFKTLPEDEPDEIFGCCDVAFSGSDFLSFPVLYQYGEDIYIPDVVFDDRDPSFTEPKVAEFICRHNFNRCQFEANAGGDFYARDIQDKIQGRSNARITTRRANSTMSKMARIEQHADTILTFHFLDGDCYEPGSDYDKFMRQLFYFNLNGGKKQHDDAADSLAMCAAEMRVMGRDGKVHFISRSVIHY